MRLEYCKINIPTNKTSKNYKHTWRTFIPKLGHDSPLFATRWKIQTLLHAEFKFPYKRQIILYQVHYEIHFSSNWEPLFVSTNWPHVSPLFDLETGTDELPKCYSILNTPQWIQTRYKTLLNIGHIVLHKRTLPRKFCDIFHTSVKIKRKYLRLYCG